MLGISRLFKFAKKQVFLMLRFRLKQVSFYNIQIKHKDRAFAMG